MRKYIFFLILLTASACNQQPGRGQVETLQMAKQEAVKKNLALYRRINQEVVDSGESPEGLQVREQAQKVLEMRKTYGLDIIEGEAAKVFPAENVRAYLNEMAYMLAAIPERSRESPLPVKSRVEIYGSRVEELLNENQPLAAHYVLLNLLYLEGELLNRLALEISH